MIITQAKSGVERVPRASMVVTLGLESQVMTIIIKLERKHCTIPLTYRTLELFLKGASEAAQR